MIRVAALGLVGALALAGCAQVQTPANGGQGGGGGDLDVVSVSPPHQSTGVDGEIDVTATIDAVLDRQSANSSDFSLEHGGVSVPATVSLDAEGTTLTLTPDTRLALLNEYVATLSGDIQSEDGATLGEPYSWAFATRDGIWRDASPIETRDAGGAQAPQVAVDARGNAVAVWQQDDGTRDNVWANRYTPSGGWGEPELIENEDAGGAVDPQVAMSPSGDAVVVWSQSRDIWANRYTPSGGWGEAERVVVNDLDIGSVPQIAVDPDGNATAVWHQSIAGHSHIWTNRYTPSGGWGDAMQISTGVKTTGGNPQVAMDAKGNALAVWVESNDIWAARFTPSEGWEEPGRLEANTESAREPDLAMNADGSALALWWQDDGIWGNGFTSSGGWGEAEQVRAGDVVRPKVAIDALGHGLAVWYGRESTFDDIWAARFTPSEGWGDATLIEDEAGDARRPNVAMDPRGNGLAVWVHSDGMRYNVRANRFTVSAGWADPTFIEKDPGDGSILEVPAVAIDPHGYAVSVWSLDDGTRRNVWANQFD